MMLMKLDLVTPIPLQRRKLRPRETTVEELSGSRIGPLSYPLHMANIKVILKCGRWVLKILSSGRCVLHDYKHVK